MVEELAAARGIELTYAPQAVPLGGETVRRWAVKFGLRIARRIRPTSQARGDK